MCVCTHTSRVVLHGHVPMGGGQCGSAARVVGCLGIGGGRRRRQWQNNPSPLCPKDRASTTGTADACAPPPHPPHQHPNHTPHAPLRTPPVSVRGTRPHRPTHGWFPLVRRPLRGPPPVSRAHTPHSGGCRRLRPSHAPLTRRRRGVMGLGCALSRAYREPPHRRPPQRPIAHHHQHPPPYQHPPTQPPTRQQEARRTDHAAKRER